MVGFTANRTLYKEKSVVFCYNIGKRCTISED